MGHSIAAKYAARLPARFVRPSTRARERRLGLTGGGTFSPATRQVTVLRSGIAPLGGHPGRRAVRTAHPVRMVWARSDRPGPGGRSGAAAAPWRG